MSQWRDLLPTLWREGDAMFGGQVEIIPTTRGKLQSAVSQDAVAFIVTGSIFKSGGGGDAENMKLAVNAQDITLELSGNVLPTGVKLERGWHVRDLDEPGQPLYAIARVDAGEFGTLSVKLDSLAAV